MFSGTLENGETLRLTHYDGRGPFFQDCIILKMLFYLFQKKGIRLYGGRINCSHNKDLLSYPKPKTGYYPRTQ